MTLPRSLLILAEKIPAIRGFTGRRHTWSLAQIAGPLALAAGLSCVLIVLWLALSRSSIGQKENVVSFLEEQRAWEASQPTTDQMAAQVANTETGRMMDGLWIARFEEGTAAFLVSHGVFQILYYPSVGTIPREYERGVLEFKKGFVILTPREDLGAPDPVISNGRFFPYKTMTLRAFAFKVERENEKLVWIKGPATVSNIHETESFHPLFDLASDGRIVWDPPPPETTKAPRSDPSAPAPVTESEKAP